MTTNKYHKLAISITNKAICKSFFRITQAYVKYLYNNYYRNVTTENRNDTFILRGIEWQKTNTAWTLHEFCNYLLSWTNLCKYRYLFAISMSRLISHHFSLYANSALPYRYIYIIYFYGKRSKQSSIVTEGEYQISKSISLHFRYRLDVKSVAETLTFFFELIYMRRKCVSRYNRKSN